MVQQVKPIKTIFDFGGIMKIESFIPEASHILWMFGKKFYLTNLDPENNKAFYTVYKSKNERHI
jgi:hypothetical protein